MIVVSNTTPLNYLVLINAQDVLPALYSRVLIPTVVYDELQSDKTPAKVRLWLQTTPSWLEVRESPEHAAPENIHAGEAAAIALAKSVKAALVLMDDYHARQYATEEGLRVTGTLGVLRDAAGQDLIDLRSTFDQLKQTNFRAPPDLLVELLREAENKGPI